MQIDFLRFNLIRKRGIPTRLKSVNPKSEPESNGYVPYSHSSSMNYKETAMKPSKATQANPV